MKQKSKLQTISTVTSLTPFSAVFVRRKAKSFASRLLKYILYSLLLFAVSNFYHIYRISSLPQNQDAWLAVWDCTQYLTIALVSLLALLRRTNGNRVFSIGVALTFAVDALNTAFDGNFGGIYFDVLEFVAISVLAAMAVKKRDSRQRIGSRWHGSR